MNVRIRSLSLFSLVILGATLLNGCYDHSGYTPEARKARETKRWTDADVNQVVSEQLITIPGGEPASPYGAPKACDNVSFLRFKSKDAPADAEQADAAFLMVPGVLEGANGFEFMGRQMVYMAQKEFGKHIEVWAMDRRANCLEDLTGTQAAEQELDRKYSELVSLRSELEGLLEEQSEEEQKSITKLVKMYEGMKAKDAAAIFNSLDIDILVNVISRMSERKSAPILAAMNPDRARTVTIMLAEERQLPTLPGQ